MSFFGTTIRVPFMSGLVNMVVGYVMSLVMVYVLALIANALAPTFKGEKNLPSAVKLVAYGATAGMVGGRFQFAAHAVDAGHAGGAVFDLPDLHRYSGPDESA